jgi:hypothetical protein
MVAAVQSFDPEIFGSVARILEDPEAVALTTLRSEVGKIIVLK